MSALIDASYANYTAKREVVAPPARRYLLAITGTTPPARMRKFPKQARSRLMVMSIKQAALELVTRRKDTDDIKVIDIADVCGISTGSLYQYFDCLESILAAIYEDVILHALNKRGTQIVSAQDYRKLTLELGQLDRLFGCNLLEDVYAPHMRTSLCACDVALLFVGYFGSYQNPDAQSPIYWQDYLVVN